MPDEETNPTQVEETNPDAADATNPDEGSAPAAGGESNATAAESPQLTAEQYAELQEKAKKYESLEPEYRRVTQTNAELERQKQIAEAMLDAARGREQAAVDPEQAAWQEYQQAKQDYDPAAEAAALQKWAAARETKRDEALVQRIRRENQIQMEMPKAAEMLNLPPAQAEAILTRQYQSLTPTKLALLELADQGKLADHITAQQRQREEMAAQANLLKSLAGGGGTVPGANRESERTAPAAIEHWNFSMWNKATQKEWLDRGNVVVDTQSGEVLDNPMG